MTRPVDGVTRVCLVSPLPPPPGGIARWTAMVTAYARECSPDVELLIVDTAVRLRPPAHASTAVRVLTGALEGLRILAAVTRRLVIDHPHVLHLNSPGSLGTARDLVVLVLARAARVPVVYHLRFGRVPDIASRHTAEWRLLRRVARMASVVICIDAATAEALAHFAPEVHAIHVPNCVDLRALPDSAGTNVRQQVIFVGWHVVTKGVEELVTAWRRAAPPGWSLRMVGPADDAMLGRLGDLAGDSDVRFDGPLRHEEVLLRVAESEVLVLPSHTEGFPNVVVEAMALEKPVVVTPVGALPEMVAGGAGLLVPVGDVDALVQALVAVMEDRDLRVRMGRLGGERARALYSLDVVFAEYRRIWRCSGPRAAGL